MRIGLFGGTFDPIHRGHLAVARAAARNFELGRIYFVPANLPPHKQKRMLADFQHRFAMLALATAEDKRFVPSLLDANPGQPNYSVQTVRRLKKEILGKTDKLFFLIGMDAFKDIATWRQPVELLGECDFIVAARPGYSLGDVGRALPEILRPPEAALRSLGKQQSGTISLPGVTIHLLADVHERVSSTQIRAAARKPMKYLSRYVPPLVAEYIKKENLYATDATSAENKGVSPSKVLSFQRGHH